MRVQASLFVSETFFPRELEIEVDRKSQNWLFAFLESFFKCDLRPLSSIGRQKYSNTCRPILFYLFFTLEQKMKGAKGGRFSNYLTMPLYWTCSSNQVKCLNYRIVKCSQFPGKLCKLAAPSLGQIPLKKSPDQGRWMPVPCWNTLSRSMIGSIR